MARTDTLGNFLTDVAEAIRTKEGTTETIPASEFDTRISNLSGGEDLTEELTTYNTELEEQNLALDDIVLALKNKGSGSNLQNKTLTVKMEPGTYIIIPDEEYDGLSQLELIVASPGYQGVEYIQTNSYEYNTNYIDTGFVANNNTTLEVKFAFHTQDTQYSRVYGGDNASRNFLTATPSYADTRLYFMWGGQLSDMLLNNFNYNAQVIRQEKNKVYWDGNLIYTFTGTTWTDIAPIRLFSASGGDRDGVLRMYYCKIWDGDTLVRDFVPCYRKSDNEIGMYDKVEEKFYPNDGTVAFTKSDIKTEEYY